jgi:heme exporter protein B
MTQGWLGLKRQIGREWRLSCRQLGVLINASLFFLMLIIFFPLTLQPEPGLLRQIAPGLIWLALLLSMLLSADRLFKQDYEQGILEQWLVSGRSLPLLLMVKIGVLWLITLLPLLVIMPLFSLFFGLNAAEIEILLISVVLGSPALFYLCALASVLGMSVNQQFTLLALIFLPLTLPVLIFGSGCLALFLQGQPVQAYLALLAAFSLLAMALLPWAIAGVIRISLGD